jgi:tRNA threonylcarbamoyl adenosine modification protein YeaZ
MWLRCGTVLILAFDTATPAVTVALHDGARVLAHDCAVDARRHGELLAPSVAVVLAKAGAVPADLTTIAVGTGPGPYTGLRVGLMTARAMGAALGIGVRGICSLDVIAAQAAAASGGAADREFIVATDARRGEIYWALYSAQARRLSGPMVSLPALVPAGYPVAGQGPLLHPELGEAIEPPYPSAGQLAAIAAAQVAAGAPAAAPEPLYLRRPDAREPGRPKRVTP